MKVLSRSGGAVKLTVVRKDGDIRSDDLGTPPKLRKTFPGDKAPGRPPKKEEVVRMIPSADDMDTRWRCRWKGGAVRREGK